MPLPKYEEHEGDFLEAIATRYGFTGKNALIFEKRFLEANASLTHESLAVAAKFAAKLTDGTKNGEPARIFRQQLSAICENLEKEGCPPSTGQDRWKTCKRWLREVVFLQWAKEQGLIAETLLTFEEMWEKLKAKATLTDKMGPVLVPAIGTLEMWEQPSQYLKTVPQEKHIQFHIELEESGYLILLEKGSSGKLWCLCPSFFAPQSYVNAGKVILPQENPRQKTFKTSRPGSEELVALIAANFPPFPWLPKSNQNPLQLQEFHIRELLEYLDGGIKSSILYMDYAITAA